MKNRDMKSAYTSADSAKRYDSARALPPETKALWIEALKAQIPASEIKTILDLGCGTGRFTLALSEAFGSQVIGVEPSTAMLEVATSQSESNVVWKQGQAESIPLESEAVDLVFMSQIFHHLQSPRRAIEEINRVLTPAGYLAIRNGMREHNGELQWLKYFPEAAEIEERRTPSSEELKELVCSSFFKLISHRIIHQLFASSYQEYFEKISRRALSALVVISDEAFQTGLQQFRDWVNLQPDGRAVYEPVDLFIFQKKQT